MNGSTPVLKLLQRNSKVSMTMEPIPSKSEMPHAEELTETPPISQEELQHELDSLLISYLEEVDGYTRLQKQITDNLSSGFLNLAHANFNVSGRRFGQDFYDERAKAMKGVQIECSSKLNSAVFQLQQFPFPIEDSNESMPVNSKEKTSEVRRRKTNTKDITVESENVLKEPDNKENTESDKEENTKVSKRDPRDPLRWFGILVPQTLKMAQMDFSKAVEMIPELATSLRRMNFFEAEISRIRTVLKDVRGDAAQLETLLAGVRLEDDKNE